jgi:hypothetical protein
VFPCPFLPSSEEVFYVLSHSRQQDVIVYPHCLHPVSHPWILPVEHHLSPLLSMSRTVAPGQGINAGWLSHLICLSSKSSFWSPLSLKLWPHHPGCAQSRLSSLYIVIRVPFLKTTSDLLQELQGFLLFSGILFNLFVVKKFNQYTSFTQYAQEERFA